MAVYTIADLIVAIAATLGAAPSLTRTQYAGTTAAVSRLTEGAEDLPLLQVYPEANTTTDWTGETDRITLSGKHSIKEYTIHADLLARQRSHIDEDMAQLVATIDEFEDILDTQVYQNVPDGTGLFGRLYITSFQWSWHRVVFEYASVWYIGARFPLVIRCGTEVRS